MPATTPDHEAASEPPFVAVLTPSRSLDARGLRLASLALGGAALLPGLVFWTTGAWPILGFLGAAAALAVALLRWHHGAGRTREVLRLEPARLTVLQVDRRGRQREMAFQPYWVRLELAEEAGRAPRLYLRERGRAVRVGAFLATPELHRLAAALGGALARLRQPRFDNPQLRVC